MEIKHFLFTTFLLLVAVSAVHGLCNYGAVGICGRLVPFPCPFGSTCRHLLPGVPFGLCCLNRPDSRCPAPSRMVNACSFNVQNPTGNCLNNSDCPNGQVCCPDACGGACKNPVA